ncbi:solute carrier family 23 member 2 [Erpetoichthys calabaricus]|uniref:solute carrier family 23 member 2 n=1 Tax=Erpetoichthys calabaricus TaxID=27687 RepID=UPI00223439F2|nr:solute carrier family 23 member 2 [Erpetoichthys calabaricus]
MDADECVWMYIAWVGRWAVQLASEGLRISEETSDTKRDTMNSTFENSSSTCHIETIILDDKDEKSEDKPQLDLIYAINDRPPWYLCLLLGFQHYILAFGGIIAIPLILADAMCIEDNNVKSRLISTIFFVSGLCTLLQTTFGSRLPILQGGTFSFLTPTLAILALPEWACPHQKSQLLLNSTTSRDDEAWKSHMCEIQGAIIVASLLQILLGFTGLIGFILRFIGPLAIAPTITLVGLSLFIEAGKKSGSHWAIAALTMGLIILFSQYLSNVNVPLIIYSKKKWKIIRYPVFKLFSVLLGMCLSWLLCFLLTVYNVLPTNSNDYGYYARTDIRIDAVKSAPWIHFPYPCQWGLPTVSLSSVLGMMSGVLASTLESVGDYYACARLSGAPVPPFHAINRAVGIEGIGCVVAGIFGTGNGTTSYSQNIAALGITKVGSRLVLQSAGILMLCIGLFGKLGAVFITIPNPVIGGMLMVMFGMISAVGISNLQFVDLNSSRNLLILGFSIFSGLVIPTWFHSNKEIVNTGIRELDQVIIVLLTTNMFVGGFLGFFLDNTIPGTEKERGIKEWRKTGQDTQGNKDDVFYELPYMSKHLHNCRCARYVPFLPTYKTI